MDLVKALNSQYMKEELPEAKVGKSLKTSWSYEQDDRFKR